MSLSRNPRASGLSRWLLTLLAAAWAGAAVADTYMILSLVGDQLTVVGHEAQVGSNLDKNRYKILPLRDPALDDFAVRVADATIAKARPDASVITLRANDPKLYALRNTWLDTDVIDAKALLSLVAKQLPPSTDAHLVLIAPYRNELELRTDRNYLGTGKVAGLGFYLNRSTHVLRSDTFQEGVGFLGAFANFQLVLINMQSNAVEAHERAVIGTTYAASQAPDGDPWNALTPAQKITALQSLLKREIERLLPGMLTASRRP